MVPGCDRGVGRAAGRGGQELGLARPGFREGVRCAYIIALINVTTPEQYPEDAKRAAPVSAKQGGPYLVRSGAKHPPEGDIPFQRIVVAEFASVEAAKKCDHSPEYQEARKHRLGAADLHMAIVEGAS
jgi:uncharacterized protein (DUF1330 family)